MINWDKTANGMHVNGMVDMLASYLRKLATRGGGYDEASEATIIKSLKRVSLVRGRLLGAHICDATNAFFQLLSSHNDLRVCIDNQFEVKVSDSELLLHEQIDEDFTIDEN